MRYEPEERRLVFADAAEVEAFHAEVSALLREATVAVASSAEDPEVATGRVRELLAGFATVTGALNALRAHLPRRAV